jgi:hypothetical protein
MDLESIATDACYRIGDDLEPLGGERGGDLAGVAQH